MNDNSGDEVIYHGYHRSSATVSLVTIETEQASSLACSTMWSGTPPPA
ncbi:MAG: hypothetical protein ABR528_01255 [Pseudonocardiaceae bacterium]